MQEVKSEAIVLSATAFRDRKWILRLFSQQEGVIQAMLTRVSRKNVHRLALTMPLLCAEFVYQRKRSDFVQIVDATILSSHIQLRQSALLLQVSGQLIRAILQTQLLGKPAPLLYALLRLYLRRLPQAADPCAFGASFHLKLLQHEGLLQLQAHCAQCAESSCFFSHGEMYCQRHAPYGAIACSGPRLQLLQSLLNTRSLPFLQRLALPSGVMEVVSQMFSQAR